MDTKELLHDERCEQQVLGVLLTYRDCYDQFQDYCTEEVFFNTTNRYLYGCISGVISDGKVPDITSLFEYTQKHPKPGCSEEEISSMLGTITDIACSVVSSVTFEQNCMRLADLYSRRIMSLVGQELFFAGISEMGDTDEIKTKAIEKLQSIDERPQTSILSIKEALITLNEIVNDNISGTRTAGYPTGFKFLDEKGGMQPNDLWVIAADSSQGKTSLAIDFAYNSASSGYAVAYYSTEMQSTQLVSRMVAGRSGISSQIIMQKPLKGEYLSKFDKTIGKLEGLPIYFDDTSTLSVDRVISSIRSMVRHKGVKVAFVDFLQTFQVNERNMKMTEEQFYGISARKFKNLAKELQICIVLVSQLSRPRDTPEPKLSRVRGSGQIVEAADVVLLIYRPEYYGENYSGNRNMVSTKGTAQIKLAKGRNIGTGDFICGFNGVVTHFYDLQETPTKNDYSNTSIENDPY